MDGVPVRTAAGVVGPNAVLQTAAALEARYGAVETRRVFDDLGLARLLDHPPTEMIDETIAATLLTGLWRTLPVAEARAVAEEAGRRTADYVMANRIPRAARWILGVTPAGLGSRLLLKAIHRNAWTFAGSGICEIQAAPRPLISIRANPLAMPDCAWHGAVFQRLFERLVARGTRVRHTACCLRGDNACRFEIDLPHGSGDRR